MVTQRPLPAHGLKPALVPKPHPRSDDAEDRLHGLLEPHNDARPARGLEPMPHAFHPHPPVQMTHTIDRPSLFPSRLTFA